MVIGEKFAWGHVPKTGGEATREMFGIFPELIVFSDPRGSVEQHTSFADRNALVRGKRLALNIRRLPAWIVSREQHKSRHGLWPDYTPIPMDTPEKMASTTFPDYRLGGFLDNGRFQIDRWLRTELLLDDFLAFLTELTEVTDERRARVAALGPVNVNPYDHELGSWFSAEQVERLYRNNPLWASIEERVYGGLLIENAG
jgi:hypothetical protein